MIDHPIDRLEAWLANPHWRQEIPRPEDVRAVLELLNDATTQLDKVRALVAVYEKQGRKP